MGKLDSNINGDFSGKVGNIVGVNWRGKNFVRSLPSKNNRPATEKQLAQRQKLALVSQFLKPVRAIIDQFYGSPDYQKARINNATSYHIQESLLSEGAGFHINYKRVLLTLGELIGVQQATVSMGEGNGALFSWADNSDIGQAKPHDKMLAIVYEESSNSFEYSMQGLREDSSFLMPLPTEWSGKIVQCWMSFVSEKGTHWSTSCYLGELMVG